MAALWTDEDERALADTAAAVDPVALLRSINATRALHGLGLQLQGVRVMTYSPSTNVSGQLINKETWGAQVAIARRALEKLVEVSSASLPPGAADLTLPDSDTAP
jgi:hypothetical protein